LHLTPGVGVYKENSFLRWLGLLLPNGIGPCR
jgi:hypothetical protein